MATCYNLIYNSATGYPELDGSLITSVVGISGFCDSGYVVLISAYQAGGSTDVQLNLSAIQSVTSATTAINSVIAIATAASQVSADINTTINEEVVSLKVTVNIIAKTPVITTVYNPPTKTLKTGIAIKG